MISPHLFLFSVNELPDALEGLSQLFVVTPRTQNLMQHRTGSRNETYQSILLSATTSPLCEKSSEIGVESPVLYAHKSRMKSV